MSRQPCASLVPDPLSAAAEADASTLGAMKLGGRERAAKLREPLREWPRVCECGVLATKVDAGRASEGALALAAVLLALGKLVCAATAF